MLFNIFKKKNKDLIVPSKTKIDELLPIGSVVSVLNMDHRAMIIGIKQICLDDNHEYDYVAIPYPEGQVGINSQIIFNNEDISHISFIGYQDSEHFAFIEEIKNNGVD